MKKWQKWLPALVVLGFTLAAVSCLRAGGGYGAVLKANWGFVLPRRGQCTEVYSADSGASPHGDGLRYHVYSCRDTHIESMYAWLPDEHATIYHDSFHAAADDWLGQLNVPAERRPVCSGCVYHYQSQDDHSELIVFWDEGRQMLYVLESFL